MKLVFFLALFSSFCFALTPQDDSLGNRDTEFRQVEYVFRLTQSALAKAPKWKPDSPFPPLSPRQAHTIAAAQLRKLIPADYKSMYIHKIYLEALDESDADWIYMVEFAWDDHKGWAGPLWIFTIPVYLDGSTIIPNIRKLAPNLQRPQSTP